MGEEENARHGTSDRDRGRYSHPGESTSGSGTAQEGKQFLMILLETLLIFVADFSRPVNRMTVNRMMTVPIFV